MRSLRVAVPSLRRKGRGEGTATRRLTNVNLPFPYLTPKSLVPNLFLGYFIHIVHREREGIFAKDLRECKVFV